MAAGAPASTSAFQAAGMTEGEEQSHRLAALPEFLHNTHWPSLSTWRCLAAREVGKRLNWVPCRPRQSLGLRKKEDGRVGWQLVISVPGPVSWLPSLDWWWGQEGLPCPRTEYTENGRQRPTGLEKEVLDEFPPHYPKGLKPRGRDGPVGYLLRSIVESGDQSWVGVIQLRAP